MPSANDQPISLTAVDVFAGGGGLTVGLKRAGFRVVGAVELESNAFATYKANHPEVTAFRQDVRTITGESLLRLSPTGQIDLLAGCPPCQGFSSLTSNYKEKYNRTQAHPGNRLVRQMTRLIEEVKPHAIMMENVPGLGDKGKRLFNELLRTIKRNGYLPQHDVLQVADFGVPQSRRRLVLLAGLGFKIDLPKPTHARGGTNGLKPWTTVRDTIYGMQKPVTLSEALGRGGPQAFNWHVIRTLSSLNLRRVKAARSGMPWYSIPKNLRPSCHKNRNAGFSNVYGRMRWTQAAPTITGGCTTLSKGRFGHPVADRTISVREAARLQTFPDDYVFDTQHMEHVCNIVGNALPCDFAEVLSLACAVAIREVI